MPVVNNKLFRAWIRDEREKIHKLVANHGGKVIINGMGNAREFLVDFCQVVGWYINVIASLCGVICWFDFRISGHRLAPGTNQWPRRSYSNLSYNLITIF